MNDHMGTTATTGRALVSPPTRASGSGRRRAKAVAVGAALLLAAALTVTGPASSAQTTPARGIVCTDGSYDAGTTTRTFDLEISTGFIYMPDGNTIFMWSYNVVGGDFQVPGPTLCAIAGETIEVTLHNTLAEPTSIVFPGQTGVTGSGGSGPGLFAQEAAAANPGATDDVTYTFDAVEGTYLYESGTNQPKQIEMGLAGALVVRPPGFDPLAPTAYGEVFHPEREHVLILAEIDPDIHLAVERGQAIDPTARHDRYFIINGRGFPDVISDNFVPWLPSQPYGGLVTVQPYDTATTGGNQLPAMIRYLNAGLDNHPFHPHANHLSLVARDGRALESGGQTTLVESFTKTIGAGQTADMLFTWTDEEQYRPLSSPDANPVPVDIPGYRNLLFAGGQTSYSGRPYLGYQGTLPRGVTSYNECGEYYFPWHSHDLIEIVNFDEAFGGMMTLLRVDPTGGCG